ncbi:MAG: acetate--CoA ligase family protein, partial [Longimicrobiales bacterium]|nr:acetate--CoA ligase family protein [Longimicrobiales bacterium]
MYAAHRSSPLEILGRRGVPVVASLEVACRCVAELQRRGAWLAMDSWAYTPPGDGGDEESASEDGRPEALAQALREGRTVLSEPEARALLAAAGLEFGPSFLARSADDVADALRTLGRPVVVKVVSRAILHKSDAGGVVVGVSTEEEAKEAYRSIQEGARSYGAAHGMDVETELPVMVVPQLSTPRAELLVGAYRDPGLGPVVMLGAGGLGVEALADVSIRVLPVDDEEVREMLDELRIAPVLAGGRGRSPVAMEPIVATARAVCDTMLRWPQVTEVETNPLFVYEDRAAPVDARVVLTPDAQAV